MPISYIGNTAALAAETTNPTVAVAQPTCAVGDLLIAFLVNKPAAGVANAFNDDDSTWTELTQGFCDCATAADEHQYAIFYKFATATTGTHSFTKALDDNLLSCGVIAAYRGVDKTAPIDTTSPGVTTTTTAADNVSFPAFDPTYNDVHVVFAAFYGNSATGNEFALDMSNETNPDCTRRFTLGTNTGSDAHIAVTSGDNDGSSIASRTWASQSTDDSGNTGVVFALKAALGKSLTESLPGGEIISYASNLQKTRTDTTTFTEALTSLISKYYQSTINAAALSETLIQKINHLKSISNAVDFLETVDGKITTLQGIDESIALAHVLSEALNTIGAVIEKTITEQMQAGELLENASLIKTEKNIVETIQAGEYIENLKSKFYETISETVSIEDIIAHTLSALLEKSTSDIISIASTLSQNIITIETITGNLSHDLVFGDSLAQQISGIYQSLEHIITFSDAFNSSYAVLNLFETCIQQMAFDDYVAHDINKWHQDSSMPLGLYEAIAGSTFDVSAASTYFFKKEIIKTSFSIQ